MKVSAPASMRKPFSPPVSDPRPSSSASNVSVKMSVMIPVKMTPSERRTAMRLSNPPVTHETSVANRMLTTMGRPTVSARMAPP